MSAMNASPNIAGAFDRVITKNNNRICHIVGKKKRMSQGGPRHVLHQAHQPASEKCSSVKIFSHDFDTCPSQSRYLPQFPHYFYVM